MNKVNLCWVISDGRKGHEIQSKAVAHSIAHNVRCFTFESTWLQKILAPSSWGHRLQKTIWNQSIPDNNASPDIIISCGRQAAAAGRAIKQLIPTRHIQILNPKGQLSDYDLLLVPKHDDLEGSNICQFTGSIHTVGSQAHSTNNNHEGTVAVILGNPYESYWQQQWPSDWLQIRQTQSPIYICGSPRLSTKAKHIIKNIIKNQAPMWLDDSDGQNPYLELLTGADKFFVTADSINMVNECLSTGKEITLLADQQLPSERHRKFIEVVKAHLSNKKNASEVTWPDPITEIINCEKLQNLLNSPSSLSKG